MSDCLFIGAVCLAAMGIALVPVAAVEMAFRCMRRSGLPPSTPGEIKRAERRRRLRIGLR